MSGETIFDGAVEDAITCYQPTSAVEGLAANAKDDGPRLAEENWHYQHIIEKASRSGMKNIPNATAGGKVLVELKSVETRARVHKKQVLTYLKLSHLKLGL